MRILIQFIFGSILSWLAVWFLLPILRKSCLDTPNQRSSHLLPTPRGGGIAFVLIGSSLNFMLSQGPARWIPIICLPLALVGFVDDREDVPAAWRYFIQLATSGVLVYIAKLSVPWWSFIFCMVLITSIINFFNFMDGMDGLVAGCGFLLLAATSSWSLSGAIFGFLLWNWSPAKVFMGDVGSTFIGAVFAGSILQQPTFHLALTTFLLCFPLFADATICLLKRLVRGENIFMAHRKHLFQRLNKGGWSHAKVSFVYILATLLLILANHIAGLHALKFFITLEIVIAFYLNTKVAAKFDNS